MRRRHRHRLVEQLQVLTADNDLVGGLDEREVRVVRHDSLRKRGELHPLLAKLVDLPHDLFDRSLAVIEDRTQLDPGGFDNPHYNLLVSLESPWAAGITPGA
jgi:hypothetical protein